MTRLNTNMKSEFVFFFSVTTEMSFDSVRILDYK